MPATEPWDDLPDVPQMSPVFPAAEMIFDSVGEIESPPVDPLYRFDFEIRHRPKAEHWPAPYQAKIRLNGVQRAFYGTTVNSVLDAIRREIE